MPYCRLRLLPQSRDKCKKKKKLLLKNILGWRNRWISNCVDVCTCTHTHAHAHMHTNTYTHTHTHKVPSSENTELKRSPFKAQSRSVYSHTCYAYCQGFFPCLFLLFQSIYLHFSQNLSWFLLCWLWLTHGPYVGPQNKIGHPAICKFPFWEPAEYN